MNGLRERGRQLRELTRLFFARFLENDLICIDGDTRSTLINILGLLAAPGVFYPLLGNFVYGPMYTRPLYERDIYSLPDKGLYLAFSMTVLGILVVLEWDTLLPDRRDYYVLQPFPIRLRTILSSKVAALAGLWGVFTVAVNAFSSIAFPMVVVQADDLRAVLWFARGHVLAILAGNAFVFLALISVQAVLMSVLGWRWFRRVSPYAQGLLVAGLLLTFFCEGAVVNGIRPGQSVTSVLRFYPPAWFLGLYQSELGWQQPVFRELAGQARLALAVVAGIAAAGFAFSYRRHVSRSLESPGAAAAPGRVSTSAGRLLDRVMLRSSAERAAFHFVCQTAFRSRTHRSVLAAWAGVGFALVAQGLAGAVASGNRTWWRNPEGILTPVPIVLSFFLLCGIRYMFTVPAELQSNWLFRVSGRTDAAPYMPGVRKAAALFGIAPLFAVLLPIHIAIWGWLPGCIHVVFGSVTAWLLLDVLLLGFAKLPFTCSYVPGKANVRGFWPLYAGGFLAYVALLTGFEILILRKPARIVWLLLFAAAVKSVVLWCGRRLRDQDRSLVFDERPEPAVRTLNLMQP